MCATEEKDEKVQGRINADTDRDEEGEKVQGQIIPDTDRDDQRRPDALKAWAQRLAVAVKAELITADDAKRAMERACK